MKKLLLILSIIFLAGCASSVKVESHQADFERSRSINDLDYHTGEKTPIMVMNISVTGDIVRQYPGLADKRVGLGLTNRILENFEETGYFRYTEEKDEILNKMLDQWDFSDAGIGAEGTGVQTGSLILPTYFVYAELYEFSTSTEESIVRGRSEIENTTIVGFQIRLVSVATGEFIIASGQGRATQRGEGFFANPNMQFDQSTVGIATQKALETATVNLINRSKRRGWL
jgi:hypothetical protein